MQWWIRPGPSRCCASANPEPSRPDEVPGRHPHIQVLDLGVVPEAPVRRVRILHRRHVPDDVHPGRLGRDDDHRRSLVRMDVWIGHRHHDQEVRHGSVGREPLVPVDHPLVAVPHGRRRQQRRIGSSGVGLRHGEGGSQLTVEQRLEPPLPLRLVPRLLDTHRQQLRVARVRRIVAEHHRAQGDCPRISCISPNLTCPNPIPPSEGGRCAAQRPSALTSLLERPHHLEQLVVGQVQRLEGEDLLPHEATHPLQLLLELGFRREIPGHDRSSLLPAQLPAAPTLPLPWAP